LIDKTNANDLKLSIHYLLTVSSLNAHLFENLPSPLFAKEGHYSSLWQREVRRDFIKLMSLL
jgi:hypothetical protein